MKINAKITFLVDRYCTRIELYDTDSCITFLEIELTPEQLSSALSRVGYTDVKSAQLYDVHKIGKIRELKTVEFEVPLEIKALQHNSKEFNKSLTEYSQKLLDEENEGWRSSKYFESRGSIFYKSNDNEYTQKMWARDNAVRWVEKKSDV